MDVAEVIAKMHQAGFTLAANGGRLSVSPADRLTDQQRQFIRDHKPGILAELKSEAAILGAGQPGSDIEAANGPEPIVVTVWTPAGHPVMVAADSPEHAEWIRHMNPPPAQRMQLEATEVGSGR